MAETIIKLRRDTEANYAPVASSFIPMKGEVCFVDTADGLKYKVGDGTTYFINLEYESANPEVISGYYLNNKFYRSSTYVSADELTPTINIIYIDKNTNVLYHYDAVQTKYVSVNDCLPTASDVIAGIAKLYNTSGSNLDGSMTQASITNGIDDVKFSVAEDDAECLVLNKPW